MKKRISAKIRGTVGETITETLVALLISALGLLMLAGAIAASTRVITNSKEKMKEYYAANQHVEMHTENGDKHGTLSIQLSGYGNIRIEDGGLPGVRLEYFLNDTIRGFPVMSYAIMDATPSSGE